jgi:signal transduction histidine kinase
MERFLDTMLADTERLNALISNFLMAAKLEQRPANAGLTLIDFSAFVEKFVQEFQGHLPEGNSLTTRIETGISAKVDIEGMEMVLRNLLENAFLYSTASPEVQVELCRDNKNCILTVSDNGRGIASKDFNAIFRMFYRVRNTGETIRGTGLGLYIVKSIVKRHKGSIRVKSAGAGKGSRFIISLPIVEIG